MLDDGGKPVPQDGKTIGEVCARSNVVLKGYWKQPEETAKAIHDGYFHTGDLAVWDEFGNIHIVDRKKDVIISGGENISSPGDGGRALQAPGGARVRGHRRAQREVGRDAEGARRAARGRLGDEDGDHRVQPRAPRPLQVPDARSSSSKTLPRTATGKLQKYLLREKYWKGRERKVAGVSRTRRAGPAGERR